MLFANQTNKKKRICLIILLCILFLFVSFFSFQTIIYADDVESLYVEYIGEVGNEAQQQDSKNYVVKAVLKNGRTKTVRSTDVVVAVKNNVATLAYKGVATEYFFTEQIEVDFSPDLDDILLDHPKEVITIDTSSDNNQENTSNSSGDLDADTDTSSKTVSDGEADNSTSSASTSSIPTSSGNTSSDGGKNDGYLPPPRKPPLPPVVSIKEMLVVSPPTKTTYLQGDLFDTTGLVIKVVYSNGAEKNLVNIQAPEKKLMPVDKKIIITYKFQNSVETCEIPITVTPRTPTVMTITNIPDKLDYIEDMEFDVTGLAVQVEFDNGDIVNEGYTIPSQNLIFDQAQLEVSYSENNVILTEKIDITVAKKTPLSLAIEGIPVKQIEDISFNPESLIVRGTYDNGKTYPITGYTYDQKVLAVGADTIPFSYSENGETVTTDLDITVVKKTPVSLAVEGTPVKQIEDISFNPSSLVVKSTYDNGKSYIVTGYSYDKKVLAVGADTIPFSYSDNGTTVTTDLDIMVVKKTPAKLSVVTPPTKTNYIEETKFSKDGLTLSVEYDNKNHSPVSGFVVDDADLNFGQSSTKVGYTENGTTVTADLDITVVKKTPVSLAVEGTPVKQIEDISFSPASLVVKSTCDNGKSYAVTGYSYDKKVLAVGADTIPFSYSENGATVTTDLDITVVKKTPVSLAVEGTPIKQIEDISFNPASLVVKAAYDNGKSYIITDYTYDKKVLVVGADTILFSYTENGATVTTDFDITVAKKIPVALAINEPPTKTAYSAGQRFRDAGMVIEATYDNGKKQNVTGCTFADVQLVEGQSAVEISYTENLETVTTTYNLPSPVSPQQAVFEKYSSVLATCASCRGSGKVTSWGSCSACWGTGQTTCTHDYGFQCGYPITSGTHRVTCTGCGGSGSRDTVVTCSTCKGNGKSGYKIGSFISSTAQIPVSSFPNNGRHSDGYWYVLKTLIEDLA